MLIPPTFVGNKRALRMGPRSDAERTVVWEGVHVVVVVVVGSGDGGVGSKEIMM